VKGRFGPGREAGSAALDHGAPSVLPACTRPLRRSPCDGRPTGAARTGAGSATCASARHHPGGSFLTPASWLYSRWLVRRLADTLPNHPRTACPPGPSPVFGSAPALVRPANSSAFPCRRRGQLALLRRMRPVRHTHRADRRTLPCRKRFASRRRHERPSSPRRRRCIPPSPAQDFVLVASGSPAQVRDTRLSAVGFAPQCRRTRPWPGRSPCLPGARLHSARRRVAAGCTPHRAPHWCRGVPAASREPPARSVRPVRRTHRAYRRGPPARRAGNRVMVPPDPHPPRCLHLDSLPDSPAERAQNPSDSFIQVVTTNNLPNSRPCRWPPGAPGATRRTPPSR
jgi:hypothetical protein